MLSVNNHARTMQVTPKLLIRSKKFITRRVLSFLLLLVASQSAIAEKFALECRFVQIICEPRYGCDSQPTDRTGVSLFVDTDAETMLFRNSTAPGVNSTSNRTIFDAYKFYGEFRQPHGLPGL